jgi:ABC-type multidrug transport system fused ATPase/permease subunit
MKVYLRSVRLSIVELSAGKIEIDGYDISTIGLNSVRRNLALVPQDNVLFSGTLRQNLYVHQAHLICLTLILQPSATQ